MRNLPEENARRVAYWRRNLWLTGIFLALWFLATFVMAYFARELSEVRFLGWPLGFYMAAQGSLLVYVVIVWFQERAMARLDEEFGFAEPDETEEAP